MNGAYGSLSALVLTEDSSSQSFSTIRQFCRHGFLLADAKVQTQKCLFQPMNEKEVRAAMIANRWKSTNKYHQSSIQELRFRIASKVLERDPAGFVFFHFDGDSAWRARNSGNVSLFDEIIRTPVKAVVAHQIQKKENRIPSQVEVDDIVDGRLFAVVPYYSIESWCFQNTYCANHICREEYLNKDVQLFTMWSQDRSLLDEVIKPKAQACLGERHNEKLAGSGFPSLDVWATEKSLFVFVETLTASRPLIDALSSTHTQS